MKLVIAEKPSMARDIATVLGANQNRNGYIEGNNYKITWAFGHLIEHYNPDTENKKWREYQMPILTPLLLRPLKNKGVKEQLDIIEKLMKEADEIINAGDAGREGELIQREIYSYLKCKKPVKRLWINSLTDEAIRQGLSNLKDASEFDCLYWAGKARSEADWYVGINSTVALTLAVNNGELFSLGRVQTPTLSIICRRYLENKHFIPEPFWTLVAQSSKDNIDFSIKSSNYKDNDQAKQDFEQIEHCKDIKVDKVVKKEKKEAPPLLFDLTNLQKEANKRYGFTASRVLEIAQKLYEQKHITYPRTGCQYIPDDVFAKVPSLIKKALTLFPQFNTSFYEKETLELSTRCVDASKITDHHALLPTNNFPSISSLGKEEGLIYALIVLRFFEAFHAFCLKDVTQAEFLIKTIRFFATGTVLKRAGWREVEGLNDNIKEKGEDEQKDAPLPDLSPNETLPLLSVEIIEGKTKPKPILTEATLLSYMETAGKEVDDEDASEAMKECGLGTPATRDSIIQAIIDRKYVVRDNKKLIPTEKGLEVYEITKDKLISSPTLTGNWEKEMNNIQLKRASFDEFLKGIKDFTVSIVKDLSAVSISTSAAGDEQLPLCPICKKRLHSFPKGIACSQECGFVVWNEVAGIKLTTQQICNLIDKGISETISGFTSKKTGKKFSAKLKLLLDNPPKIKGAYVAFDFSHNNK
jgi:DNA topoisomerase-3